MKKRLITLLLVGTLTTILATGCGLFKKDEATAQAPFNETIDFSVEQSLTVWCWDPAFNMNAMYEAEKVYQKEHPNFTLNVIETPWEDVQTLITTASASGGLDILPDILLMQDNAFHKNVIIYPSTFVDLTNSGIDYSAFAAGKTAYSVVGGRNYGVPFENGAAVGCYRTDLLEMAGLTIEDFTDITWDQFIENGKAVLEATGKPLISVQAGEGDMIMMMLQSAGASLFNEDGSANIVNNDTLKVSLETYKEMKDAGILAETNSWDEYVDSFVSGEVAGTINGCWILASIQIAEDQAGDWAVTNIPSLAGVSNATNYSNNGGSSWAITSNCHNLALAADFLASTFAGSTELYDNILPSGALTTWAPAGSSEAYAEGNDYFGGEAVSAKIVEYSTKVPSSITGAYYYDACNAIVKATNHYTNGADMQQELQAAEDTVNYNMGL